MSYPQGYLYQPPGSLALYSCPAYGASALAAPRNEDLARSSSGSAFSPYPGSAAFSASAGAGFSSPLSYSTDPTTGFPSYMVNYSAFTWRSLFFWCFFFSRFRTKCVVLFTSINALTIFDCQAQNLAQSVRNDSEWIPRKCTRNFSTECFTFHIKCYNLDSNFHLIHHPLLCRKWCVRALQTGHRLTHTIINEHYLRF